MKTDCNGCKWFVDNECVMGLYCPVTYECEDRRKPVEESCALCEYYLGMGRCTLNLEHECAESRREMYTLMKAVKRSCSECDHNINHDCTVGIAIHFTDIRQSERCEAFVSWPKVPNWGWRD